MRLRFFTALLIVVLFLNANTSHASASIHPCAPPIPPTVPGSPIPAPAISGKLLINEVLTNPDSTWNCSEFNQTFSLTSDSWIELYNPQDQPYNLYAAHASFDTGPNTLPYYLPLGASIAAHGHLVLFPGTYTGALKTGADLRLIIAGIIIDRVNIPALARDQSYARIPDGSNSWQITNTPTIDASNVASQLSTTPTASSPGQGPGGYGKAALTPTLATGTQTAWGDLQFPTPIAPIATASSVVNSTSTTSQPVNNEEDTPRRILLTTLAVALALMLFWCWRLFSIP